MTVTTVLAALPIVWVRAVLGVLATIFTASLALATILSASFALATILPVSLALATIL